MFVNSTVDNPIFDFYELLSSEGIRVTTATASQNASSPDQTCLDTYWVCNQDKVVAITRSGIEDVNEKALLLLFSVGLGSSSYYPSRYGTLFESESV